MHANMNEPKPESAAFSSRLREGAKAAGNFVFYAAFFLFLLWGVYIKLQLPKHAPIAFSIGFLVGAGWILSAALSGLKTREPHGSGGIKMFLSWFVDIAALIFGLILVGTFAGAILAGVVVSKPDLSDCAPGVPARYCD